jgi:hypothetical protein
MPWLISNHPTTRVVRYIGYNAIYLPARAIKPYTPARRSIGFYAARSY